MPGHPEVFVVGDLAFLEVEWKPLPQVAQVALQQVSSAPDSIARLIAGKASGTFVYKYWQ